MFARNEAGAALALAALTLAASTILAADTASTARRAAPDTAWLAGHWCGAGSRGESIEEHWTTPAGGLQLGVGRTLRAGRATAFEFLRLALRDGVLHYVAQPEGAPPVWFALEAAGPQSVAFANPQHDFPQRIRYAREGDRLTAEISGPGKDGRTQAVTFRFVRCRGAQDEFAGSTANTR